MPYWWLLVIWVAAEDVMKKWMLICVAVATLSGSRAEANWPPYQPYVYESVYVNTGVAFGWGYFPIVYPYYVPYYGYSYPWLGTGFGAIAYSPQTGKVGWSYAYGTRLAAEQAAQAYCGDWTCASVVWVRNGCAAIAGAASIIESPAAPFVGWAYDGTAQGAMANANYACEVGSGHPCQNLAWVCSF
jgi:serine/threonine-protein kinase